MSLSFNQSVLVESPSLRTSALSNLDDSRAQEILSKAKAIVFAVWNGSGWATTAQIAEYFSVTESAVKELTRVNQSEFQSLETKTLTGKELRDARQMLCLPSRTSQVRVFSALGALRIAMILQQSQVAAQVRTIILDLVVAVPSITPQTPVPAPALPPVEQRLQTLVEAMRTLALLTGGRLNPYMEQHFQDFAANLLAQHNQQALSGSQQKWMGVMNFAETDLGKKVPLSGSHYRGHLGTWVRTFYPQLGERQEMRLVNGTQQPVYVYACHDPMVADGLTKAIEEFFTHPNPTAALKQAGAFTTKKPRVLVKS